MPVRRKSHGGREERMGCERASRREDDAEDRRSWAIADHGSFPCRAAGARCPLPVGECLPDVRPVGAESQAPANRFFVGATRVATNSRRHGARMAPNVVCERSFRPDLQARPLPYVCRDSRRSHKKARFAGCRKRPRVARGVRRATAYFSSTRSMRNANAPAGCPAVNAMARTRARSAPLKPFSGTRISFHSGPASKLCMLGICCEPWNSIS